MSQKRLAKNSLVYALFTLLQRGFAFFLIPLYTTQLDPDEYGILGIVMAAIPFFVLIAGLSLRGSTAFFYYEYKDDRPEYLRAVWGTNFTFVLLASISFALILWATHGIFLEPVLKGVSFYPYLMLALVSVATQPVYFIYQSMLKAKQEATKAAGLDFIYFVMIVGLTLLFILGMDQKAEGALLALAISNLVVFLYSLYGAQNDLSFGIDRKLLMRTLKYSLPILPHNLSSWAMNLADRVILNGLTTLSLVGIFDIGSQIGKLINVITLGVNSAYSPWFFEIVKTKSDAKKIIATVVDKLVLIYLLIAISISWIAPELLQLIARESYYSAWKVVPFIAFAFVINGFYYSFSNVFFLEKTKYLPFISITGALINIGFNFLLIPKYGIMGAAFASLISKAIFAALAFVISQRLYHIPYKMSKLLAMFSIGFIVGCAPFAVQDWLMRFNLWTILLIKSLAILLIVLPLIWMNKSVLMSFVVPIKKRD